MVIILPLVLLALLSFGLHQQLKTIFARLMANQSLHLAQRSLLMVQYVKRNPFNVYSVLSKTPTK